MMPEVQSASTRHSANALAVVAVVVVLMATIALGTAMRSPAADAAHSPIRFQERAVASGIDFVLDNAATPQKWMIESVPGGVAAFDYNSDGLTDIYFTNGAAIPSLGKSDPRYFNRLYRNEGDWRFTDVTDSAGVAGEGYSMGASVADYDNDGDVDLFVAGVNRNILYRNEGDGRFEDVTAAAGIGSDAWSVAGGWFDYDNDGLLDLFVVNYLDWAPDPERFCGDRAANLRIYCSPIYYDGLPNTLYRNLGNGAFEDVSVEAGIAQHTGKGMSIAFADYDDDGLMDAFVTNDTEPDFLFRNLGDGTFEETGLLAGVALNSDGKSISSMGAEFRDYDNDGLPDILVTALTRQTFPIFRNLGKGMFEDAGHKSRMQGLSIKRAGWSNTLVDFDNDGWKDLFTANSHVNDEAEHFEATTYKQINSVFLNLRNGQFRDVSAAAGFGPSCLRAHRGAAFADFDNDGRIDVVVSAIGERAELWENVSPSGNHWLRVRLIGSRSNRDGIGAKIRIGTQMNHMSTSFGYASSAEAGVHFGVGHSEWIGEMRVEWPSEKVQTLENVEPDREIEVREP